MANNRKQPTTTTLSPLKASIQTLHSYLTNLVFNLEEFTPSALLPSKNTQHLPPRLYMSGKRINTIGEMKREVETLIWLTYRKNVRITPQIHTDNGWGCLLRVGQMALAKAIQQHSEGVLTRSQIVRAFIEDEQAEYSIMRVVEAGEELWDRRAGEWYSMTQTAVILQALHQRNPLKEAMNLKVKVYNQNINIEELTLLLWEYDNKEEDSTQGSEDNSFETKQIPQKTSPTHVPQAKNQHVFLMVSTSFSPEWRQEQQRQLLGFMELPIFSSCMGGVPDKARFFTSKSEDTLYYLDPHYVQESVNSSNLQPNIDTFTCPHLRSMKCRQLQSNLTICFFLRDKEDLQMLINAIETRRKENQNILLMGYAKECNMLYETQWMEPEFELLEEPSVQSGEFECLSPEELTT